MKTFGLSLTLLAAAAITGCDRQPQEWNASGPTRLCTNRAGQRVADVNCDRYGAGGGFFPYFLARGGVIPPYGDTPRGGSSVPLAGTSYGRAAAFTSSARSGGAAEGIARGGFGASAHASGGGGGE